MLFVLGAQKCNQNNLAMLLNFSDPSLTFGFFLAYFGLQISFWIRAGFGPELVGPFATLFKRILVRS